MRLAKSDSTYVLEAEPGKFDIKGREPDILFISLIIHWLTHLTSDYDEIIISFLSSIKRHWRRHSKGATSS